MSSAISTILIIGVVGIGAYLLWTQRCNISPSLCSDDPNSLFYDGTKGTVEGKTFGERGFVDSGIVNPGATPTPGKGSAGTIAATKATPNAKGHKLSAAHNNVPSSAPSGVQATCKVVNGKLVGVDSNGNVIGDCKSGLGAYSRAMSAMTVTGGRMSIN